MEDHAPHVLVGDVVVLCSYHEVCYVTNKIDFIGIRRLCYVTLTELILLITQLRNCFKSESIPLMPPLARWDLAADYAEKLFGSSNWSKTTYLYLLAVFRYAHWVDKDPLRK